MINLIRVGDDTDHGGKVETGSQTMQFDGRYVARKGDCVSCQQHPDVSPNVIEEGDTSFTDGGRADRSAWASRNMRMPPLVKPRLAAPFSRALAGPTRPMALTQSGSICICWTACWRRWC